jgi:hypothetical protein
MNGLLAVDVRDLRLGISFGGHASAGLKLV